MDEEETFYCPENRQHVLRNLSKFRSHVFKCKDLKGKTYFYCRFVFAHQFKTRQEKNLHELECTYNKRKESKLEPVNDTISYKGEVRDSASKANENWWKRNSHIIEKKKESRKEMLKLKEELREATDEMIKVFDENYLKKCSNPSLLYDMSYQETVGEFLCTKQGKQRLQQVLIEIEEIISLDSLKETLDLNMESSEYSGLFAGEFKGLKDNKGAQNLVLTVGKELKSGLSVGINRKGKSEGETLLLINKDTQHLGKFVDILCDFAILIVKEVKTEESQNSFWYTSTVYKPEDLPIITHIDEEKFRLEEQARLLEVKLQQEEKAMRDQLDAEIREGYRIKGLIEENKVRLKETETMLSFESERGQRYEKLWGELRDGARIEIKNRIIDKRDELHDKFNRLYDLESEKFREELIESDFLDHENGELETEIKKLKEREEFCNSQISTLLQQYTELCSSNKEVQDEIIYKSNEIVQPPVKKKEAKKLKCVLCLQNKREVAFFPCGHRCACKGCVSVMTTAGMHFCPVCLSRIKDRYAPIPGIKN